MDLARAGFVIENEWYWRLTEQATTFDAASAMRDYLAPLARLAADRFVIDMITADADGRGVRLAIADRPHAIRFAPGSDRVAVQAFVGDLNRALCASKVGHSFALVVPRRYELRGVLLADDELAALAGNPVMLVPTPRRSSRAV